MGLRTKAYFSGVFLACFSSMAAALGLGEIKLQSALNQPLNAEIQLLHVRGLTENEIIIGIATPEEFDRAGVERNFFVTDLDFALDLNAAQGPIVRVTSSEPVREPFLNFVVSARWPSGKLLREYTLLVDLPVFSGAQSAPVQAANQTRSPSTSPATTSRPAPSISAPQPREESPSSYASDTYGPVGANDTLWSIASRVKPDSSVSVQQTMLAIQRMNPEAFIRGNINLLRRGQVLRIPDKQEIQQLSSREAIQEVAAQNRSWNDRSADGGAQLEGSKSFSPTRTEPSSVEGRVKLSSPSSASTAGQGTGSDESVGGQVSAALNQAQEELDAADRENADLKSRIESMEEQIETMERLVEVSSEEMRALELAAQQANQTEVDSESEADSTDAQTATDVEPAPAGDVDPASESAPASEEAPVAEAQPAQPPVTATPPAQKSWMDLAMENILYIGIALGALVLALVVYLIKRNREENYEEYDDYDAEGDVDLVAAGDGEYENDKTVPLHGYDEGEEYVEEEHALAEAETEDVVGECDIHIAYGQYDQAEEKLSRALDKDPGNIPVRLKLLEVFALQGDADSFDQHYARLRTMGDADAIDRATMMRSSIDGIEPFDETFYAGSDLQIAGDDDSSFDTVTNNNFDTQDTLADDTLDFDFNDVDELVDSSATADTDDSTIDSLDFDFTQDDDITRIPAKAGTVDSKDELADLDFDLTDLDDSPLENEDVPARGKYEESADNLADLEFDMPEAESSAFDEAKSEDDLATEFDLEFGEDERFTNEFTDDLVAERSAPKEQESFDFADLELADAEQSSEASFAEPSSDMDFDLDRELEDAQVLDEEPPVLSSDTREADSDLGDLNFDDLENLELEDDQQTAALSSSEPVTVRTTASDEGSSDFDMDFDLDKDINLDELDHELDALASNFDSSSANMEEPVLDFEDDLDFSTPEAKTPPEEEGFDDLDFETDVDVAADTVSSTAVASSAEKSSDLDFEIPDFDPENDDDSNLDFLSDNDETATKLDLARAYIDMGDSDGAKDILDEILDEGNDQQKREAEALLSRIG